MRNYMYALCMLLAGLFQPSPTQQSSQTMLSLAETLSHKNSTKEPIHQHSALQAQRCLPIVWSNGTGMTGTADGMRGS
jgi:hypothetical protein